MKITISKTIETELEVPKFWAERSAVYKALSEDTCLMVISSANYPSIMKTSINMNFTEKSFEITEQVFNLRLNETKTFLSL
jgi:hypothetical protein